MDCKFSIDRKAMAKKVAERVHQFSVRIREYTNQAYNETEVRVEFVNPFLRRLAGILITKPVFLSISARLLMRQRFL